MTFQGHHRLEWTLALAGCLGIAALITLGDFLQEVGTEGGVTPSLVALITRPVQAPLANVLLQSLLSVFAALMTFVLGARVLSHRPGAVLAGMITATLFFLTASHALLFALASLVRPQGVALALTFAGLVCLDHVAVSPGRGPRLGLGVLLLALGLYVHPALVLPIAPFLILRALPQLQALRAARRPLRTWWRDPAVFPIFAFAVAATVNVAAAGGVAAGVAPVRTWPAAWTRVFAHTAEALPSGWLLVMGMATGALIVFIAVPSPRGITREELIAAVSALGVAAASWPVSAVLEPGVAGEVLLGRAVPSLVLAFVAVVAFAFTRITLTQRVRVALIALCLGLLAASTLHRYGAPSLQAGEELLKRRERIDAALR